MKRTTSILLLLLAFGVAACNRPQPGSTIVLVVRHAEKASDAEDSPLAEAGVQRAQQLIQVAEEAGVSAIYCSQFKRNLDTARPLSERTGVAITEMPVDLSTPGDYGKLLAKDILEKHRGQTIVVVGHGNTIASTIEGLTGQAVPIEFVDYSDLLIVTVSPSGGGKLIKAKYGLKSGG
jgi:broad specificity phosphatase PhoE